MKKRHNILFFIVLAVFLGGCKNDPPVARVGNQTIDFEEFKHYFFTNRAANQSFNDLDTRLLVLNQQIENKLLSDYALSIEIDQDYYNHLNIIPLNLYLTYIFY